MNQQVVVGSAFVAKYPEGGGNHWVPLQYLRGFRDLGCDTIWLEILESTGDDAEDQRFVGTFLQRLAELDLEGHAALAFYPSGFGHPDHRIVHGLPASEIDARSADAVLLNLCASIKPQLREPFARSILFDLDPGLFQIWAQQWDLGVGEHDVHLTIGQNLGAADSPIPLGDVKWVRMWPAVHLPSWPRVEQPGSAYTTITQWWSPESAWLGDEMFGCSKRDSFASVIDLPRRVAVPLELAANIHPVETREREWLASHGWRLVAPDVHLQSPQRYQQYIQQSRGEFSCAKPGYVKGRTGWLSDRSVCYLASGLPCVLQDTGAAIHLPDSPGLRFFTNVDEAAARLREVEADYPRASDAARGLAEDYFSTTVVLPKILRLAGAEPQVATRTAEGIPDSANT